MTPLSLSQPSQLRTELAQALAADLVSNNGDLIDLAWRLGQQADSLSCAVFIGYQVAMRCLVPSLKPNSWAAFVVSERGVRNPFEMSTLFHPDTHLLQGTKSYVMAANAGMDELFIVARVAGSEPVQLVAVQVPMQAVQTLPTNAQPFLPELPHAPIQFELTVQPQQLVSQQAHQQLNKPFRYFEDMHLVAAVAGWLQARVPSNAIAQAVEQLKQAFQQQPQAYHLAALDAVEQLFALCQQQVQAATAEQQAQWQRDTTLIVFTQALRIKIRERLLNVSTD